MNNNYKYLAWSGTAVLVILGIFLLVLTGHVSNTATNTNTVSFSGKGKVLAKPDIAVASFSILTEASTSKSAQDQNSQKSKKVTDFLKDQDIDEKDIKTTGYNIYPQYSYSKPCVLPMGQDSSYYPCSIDTLQKITGYQVSQSYEVKIRNLDKVSSVLDGVVTAGANQVYNLSFQIDNPEELEKKAREMAINDAKDKAKTLRKQLGISLGKIINFSENGSGWPMYYKAEVAMDGRGGGGMSGPEVSPGESEVVINVTITYQIK